MSIDLKGQWRIELETNEGMQSGVIQLPGILQGQGYGNPITNETPWISSLHDNFWYEQEEYKQAQEEECLIPFLAQPPRHFLGKAYYEREFIIEENNRKDGSERDRDVSEEWFLRIELTRWRTTVWIDDRYIGEDCSLCTAHEIPCGRLEEGRHVLKVCVDNSMQYPYRPDGHGVSDALGATWNGMVGEIVLETASEREERYKNYKKYAKEHPRKVEIKDGNFYVDGYPEYFRGTHFGGEYPLTGYPNTEKKWWLEKMAIVKEWGLNAIRCHSYCPPEAAFEAADESGVYLLVECGMWNTFREGIEMLEILREESRRILRQFGHHPSFAFFSSTNEPGGNWYQVLKEWVAETKEYDKELGYEGRRAYTVQSGWFYDVEPSKITGTDFLYFHRSAYGPYLGGVIRNHNGWRGKDYSPSLKGAKIPTICHELGQWCSYPDFKIIDKFTGYMKPGNYMVYREQARKRGLLDINDRLTYCSGRGQLRLYKEELEANFRTPEIKGFELLDLHDYLGQGSALIGFLDAFWENKGYAMPEEFRSFCGETVLLLRSPSYVWKNTQTAKLPVEISHYGNADLQNMILSWLIEDVKSGDAPYAQGEIPIALIKNGENTSAGNICIDFSGIKENCQLRLILSLINAGNEVEVVSKNYWDFHVFAKNSESMPACKTTYTKSWSEAKEALRAGENVVYSPYFSDLNYECPALSIKQVFWNSQMGPTWSRNLGLAVENSHPIFKNFPSEKAGGWQWEDILENARGLDMRGMEGIQPIVRPIDDWNRSLPLGLLFEAKVENGKLLFVSADLEGDFENRPAAYALKQAIMGYAASEEFCPQTELSADLIEQKLFPVLRMETLVEGCTFDEDAVVEREEEIFTANPNQSARIQREQFPVTLEITLKKAVEASGWLYLPEQRDRAHEGFLRDYTLEYQGEAGEWCLAAKGAFQNTSLSQKIEFDKKITAKKWRFIVYSCYGCVDKEVWKSCKDGWRRGFQTQTAVLQIAGLHLLCEEEAEHSDRIFWEKEQRSATKEIDN